MNGRSVALVAMDWTDFDHDGQSTLVLSLVTGHGGAAPLLWLSVWKEEIEPGATTTRTPVCAASPNSSRQGAG